MKRFNKFLFLFCLPTLVFAGNTGKYNILIGYGRYSLTELENPELYSSLDSKGDLYGGILFGATEKHSIGIFCGFENTLAIVKGNTSNDNFFYNTKYVACFFNYSYYSHKQHNLYLGVQSLLIRVQKHLPTDEGVLFKNSLDLTLLGYKYNINKFLSAFFEAGKSETGFIRMGLQI